MGLWRQRKKKVGYYTLVYSCNIVLIDEKNARDVAKLHGQVPKGSLYILLLAFINKYIDEKELRQMILFMTTTKFHIGGDVMNAFWMIIEKIKKQRKNQRAH